MAAFSLTAMYVDLNGTARDEYIKSAVLTVDVASLDTTDFDSAGWVEVIGGLKSGSLAITFDDDVAASAIDSVLWPLLGTVVTYEVRATNAAVGTSNPKFTGSVLINSHTLGGSVGDLAGKTVTYPTSGAVTRATA